MRAKGFSHRTRPVSENPLMCKRSATNAGGHLREIAGVKKSKLLNIIDLIVSNNPKIRFCTLSLLVSLREKGKVCVKARMPTGLRLKDKGQERQEAKTQDCQDDGRLEALLQETEPYHGRY